MGKLSLILVFCIFSLTGCASLKEDFRKFLGVSTRPVEAARPLAIKETFKCDYITCYNQTLEALKDIHAYIYRKDKKNNLIAVYVSEEDTTPVGIFFKEIDANNTQIEVASPSSPAKEHVAARLFSKLVMNLNPVKPEEGLKK